MALVPIIFGILVFGTLGLTQFAFAGALVNTVTIDGADTQGDCEKLFPDGLGGIFSSNTCTLQTSITGHIIISNINGFTLDCVEKFINAPLPGEGVGILVDASSQVTILDCQVSEFMDNILVNNSDKNRIVGNTLFDAQTNGILLVNSHENEVDSNEGMGNDFLVTLRNSNDNMVFGNTIDSNQNAMAMDNSNGNAITFNFMTNNNNMGFEIFGSTNNIISGNDIGGNNAFGLKITNSPGNEITDNEITFNDGDGLVLENSEGNIITDNDIKSNMGDGIRLLNSNKNKLMGNLIDASMPNIDSGGLGDGIFIENSQLNTISKNDIINNEANGINLFDSSDNIIINNNFVNNPNQILDDFGVDNQFNQPLPICGNYYDIFDESGDGCQDVAPANGICDDPFVFSGGEDSLPWTKPNGWLNPPPPPKTFYKGEGQRADVNEFLKYTNPKEGSTILPSRTSNYMLEIMYGDTINPSTFSAKMGKNDITSLFNPQPDKTEKISIPLIDGKNSLSLSVEGIRSDGKKSSDKDKLVFIVGGAMQQGLSPDQGLDWFIPPIKQVKQGTLAQDVVCQPQLDLIFKSSDGSPKCVSEVAAEKLVERGWAT